MSNEEGDTSEETPADAVETTPEKTPEPLDPMTADMEDLRAVLAGEREVEPEPEPQAPAEAEEAGEPSPEPEPAEGKTPSEEGQPNVEAEPETDEQLALKEIQIRLDEAEARSKHFEQKLGERAGQDGFWKQKYEALQKAQSNGYEELQDEPASPPAQVPDNGFTRWAAKIAMSNATQQFQAEHSQEDPAVIQRMMTELPKEAGRIQEILQGGDPEQVAAATHTLLNEYYWGARRAVLSEQREQLQQKRVDQSESLKAKKRASAAASSGSAPAAPKPRSKDPFTMPLEELSKALETLSD